MFKVRVYLMTTYKGIPPGDGWYMGVVEYIKPDGTPVLRTTAGEKTGITAHRLALIGAIETLKILTSPCDVEILTDSKHLLAGINTWLTGWKKKEWKTEKKTEIKNLIFWQTLDTQLQQHIVRAEYSEHNAHTDWMIQKIEKKKRGE